MLIKTNSPNYKIDSSTKAIINTNISDYQKILLERAEHKKWFKFQVDLSNALKDIEILKDQMKIVISRTEQL